MGQLNIKKIGVYGLFDRFDHDITFSTVEPITIIIGPNGFGKTTILRIVDRLFNRPPRLLGRMPFRKMKVFFNDDSTLEVSRTTDSGKVGVWNDHPDPVFKYTDRQGRLQEFTANASIQDDDLAIPASMIEDVIPELDQIGRYQWRSRNSGQILDIDDVMDMYSEILPFTFDLDRSVPVWLQEIRKDTPVRFIGTERLTSSSVSNELWRSPFERPHPRTPPERTVRLYSRRIAEMVRERLENYGNLSESLDRTFPRRFVEEPEISPFDTLQLQQRLADVDERRSRIVEAGLLGEEEEDWSVTLVDTVDASKRGVLSVYARDAIEKLSVFDDIYPRVNVFKRIANARLLYKQVSVSADGLSVNEPDGAEIGLEMLSSGEQQELVLLYDLLFETKENSLIMIDEPELSLHVAWQEELLKDFGDMAGLSNFHVLLATHSPEVISGSWNLTVELKGPDFE